MDHTHPEGRQADTEHVLDNPVYASLSSPHHAHLARGRGRVLRYLDDVAPFLGLPDHPTEQDWADAAQILGSGTAVHVHPAEPAPPAWNVIDRFDLVQMTASAVVEGAADPRAIRLEAADVPEMLDLTRRTAPGPFLRRTIELGTYFGIRQGRTLIAMAGERMRAPGWVEISAVCTAPEHQGKGLGSSLMRTLIGHITARGDNAFLHVAATNTSAVRLYKALGFTIRRELPLTVLRPPTL
ncbi:GNAT family N-acetyltransferase [Streptomyces sp. NBC_00557]|uniref:GNAT family N-acetyltransferase n=1 Tax=Streptomyces sp. NBC_00557 TaxID=2975776 RepID=UPI002E80D550|nr:GNAT family N-acetyltransferase [Streptomyces sp. NBC_00557]WUC39424.1 GNAT family N-acetyltransferase [Streptomyces sp. NBC_00557]